MGWTTPATWNPGQVISATDMNTHLRDNLNYLFSGRPGQAIKRDNNATYTTTSTSFVDIDGTNLSITLTISSGKALIFFTGVLGHTSTTNVEFDFTVDGARVGASGTDGISCAVSQGANGQGVASVVALVTGLSVGSHTFKVQWKSASGTTVGLYSGNATGGQDFIPMFSVSEVG